MASSDQTRLASTAVLGMAACALPLGVRAFLTVGDQEVHSNRAPSLPVFVKEGMRPVTVALPAWAQQNIVEESRPALGMANLGSLCAVALVAAAPAGRRCRRAAVGTRGRRSVHIARAAKDGAEENLAEQLETKLTTLREREKKLIERIEAVQQTISESEVSEAKAVDTEAAVEEAEEAEEEKETVTGEAEEPEGSTPEEEPKTEAAAEAGTTPASPVGAAYQELATLEGLADTHEDTTKAEIRMLEELSGKPKRLPFLREAGKKLKELISSEYKALRSRESELADKIAKTQEEIQAVEKAAADAAAEQEEKVKQELHILEGLATAYEDNTAAEIKALEKLAKGGKA